MHTAELVPVQTFCTLHQVEWSFIHLLQQYELIEIVTIEETAFIPEDRVDGLEQLIRLHQELEINVEGIDAIMHLLQRQQQLQQQIVTLQNKLSRYE